MKGINVLIDNTWQSFLIMYNRNINVSWKTTKLSKQTALQLLKYATLITVPYFRITSVFGSLILISIFFQILSGLILALIYIPDPALVTTYREEYINEYFFFSCIHKSHVIGADCIFLLPYIHISKKI
jgi:quinol-cytochrome oxidoreductase complex cytochrome b subunit